MLPDGHKLIRVDYPTAIECEAIRTSCRKNSGCEPPARVFRVRDNSIMKIRLLLVSLVLACFALIASDQPKTVIKIMVTNDFDKPVENAEVILDFLGSRQITKVGLRKKIHWEVHTNQQGIAHFPAVPEGAVQLQVNKKTYQTYGAKVEVAGEEQTVNIKLLPPQSQYSAHPPLKPADAPKQ